VHLSELFKKGNLGFAIDEVIDLRTRRFRKISIGDYDGRNVVVLERQIRTLEREVKELEGMDGRIADSARKIDEEIQRLKTRRVSLFAKDVRGLRNSLRDTVNYFNGDNPSSIKRQIRDFEDF
jgi:uncharacterized coiled-coil DUF342 family protein